MATAYFCKGERSTLGFGVSDERPCATLLSAMIITKAKSVELGNSDSQAAGTMMRAQLECPLWIDSVNNIGGSDLAFSVFLAAKGSTLRVSVSLFVNVGLDADATHTTGTCAISCSLSPSARHVMRCMTAPALNRTAHIVLDEKRNKRRRGSVAKVDRPEPLARCRLLTEPHCRLAWLWRSLLIDGL